MCSYCEWEIRDGNTNIVKVDDYTHIDHENNTVCLTGGLTDDECYASGLSLQQMKDLVYKLENKLGKSKQTSTAP